VSVEELGPVAFVPMTGEALKGRERGSGNGDRGNP